MRVFPDWLTAYQEYADDGFVPQQFNTWAGLSVLAGALERKVWLPWNDTFSYYPNIYVMLVSKPGAGKSVSLNKAVKVLQEANRKTSSLNIMPSQVTEAKFIELMGHGRSFIDRSAGKEITVFQNAGYYFASEASNSLRNVFGEFIACLTDFYDCPDTWERATKKDGKKISLRNVCMNILAGSTFDYLGKLVSDENIQGGFASRIIYVVHSEKLVRDQKFQMGLDSAEKEERSRFRDALVRDLVDINRLTGPMTADAEFGRAWEAWYPKYEETRQSYASEKLQSLLARTNTNVLKVSMLLCASEGTDRVMRLKHWEKALELVSAANAQVPGIFVEAKAAQGARAGGDTLSNLLISLVKKRPGILETDLKAVVTSSGHPATAVGGVFTALITRGLLVRGNIRAGRGAEIILSKDAETNL